MSSTSLRDEVVTYINGLVLTPPAGDTVTVEGLLFPDKESERFNANEISILVFPQVRRSQRVERQAARIDTTIRVAIRSRPMGRTEATREAYSNEFVTFVEDLELELLKFGAQTTTVERDTVSRELLELKIAAMVIDLTFMEFADF